MGLQFTVTHLTRMSGDRICVAGLTDSGWFLRPECAGNLHRTDVPHLFAIGARVDLGDVTHQPSPPQTENVCFERSAVKRIGTVDERGLVDLLDKSVSANLRVVFGPQLQASTGAFYVAPSEGRRSLGTLRLEAGALQLRVNHYGKLHGWWDDPELGTCHAPLTDLRAFPVVGAGHDQASVDEILEEAGTRGSVYLSVGLSKNWSQRPGHWLQLNNIIALDGPADEGRCWPTHSASKLASLSALYPDVMERHPRAWAPWCEHEDAALVRSYDTGLSVDALARTHLRRPGAIVSRLARLGATE